MPTIELVVCGLLAFAPPAAAPASAPPAEQQKEDSADARALVARVVERYSKAKTYRDTGTGTTSLAPGMPSSQLSFRTAFRRDGGMLWSFKTAAMPGRAPDSEYVVWSSDRKTWSSWWKLKPAVESTKSARLAFGTPAGISSGLSTILPTLLGVTGQPADIFARCEGMRTAGKEDVGGVSCEILEARQTGEEATVSMWIDATGAIRKHRSKRTVDPSKIPPPPGIPADEAKRMREMPKFDSVTEFVFEPVFDTEVKAEDTAFTPPADAPAKP